MISDLCMLEIVVNITRQLLRTYSNCNTAQIYFILSVPCNKALRLFSIPLGFPSMNDIECVCKDYGLLSTGDINFWDKCLSTGGTLSILMGTSIPRLVPIPPPDY